MTKIMKNGMKRKIEKENYKGEFSVLQSLIEHGDGHTHFTDFV